MRPRNDRPPHEHVSRRRPAGAPDDAGATPEPSAASRASRTARAHEAEEWLRRIVRGLRVAARQVEAAAPLSAAQLFVLQQLAGGTPMTLGELAARTMTDRTSVAHLLDRLEAQACIERRRSEQDRRCLQIVITPKGRALLSRAPLSPTAQLLDAMAHLSASELAALTVGLRRLAEEMGVAAGPAPLLFADTVAGARAPHGPLGGRARKRTK